MSTIFLTSRRYPVAVFKSVASLNDGRAIDQASVIPPICELAAKPLGFGPLRPSWSRAGFREKPPKVLCRHTVTLHDQSDDRIV